MSQPTAGQLDALVKRHSYALAMTMRKRLTWHLRHAWPTARSVDLYHASGYAGIHQVTGPQNTILWREEGHRHGGFNDPFRGEGNPWTGDSSPWTVRRDATVILDLVEDQHLHFPALKRLKNADDLRRLTLPN